MARFPCLPECLRPSRMLRRGRHAGRRAAWLVLLLWHATAHVGKSQAQEEAIDLSEKPSAESASSYWKDELGLEHQSPSADPTGLPSYFSVGEWQQPMHSAEGNYSSGVTASFRADQGGVRSQDRFPIPGQPARGLTLPGQFSPVRFPGYLDTLPHGLPSGAITIEYLYTGESFSKASGGWREDGTINYRSNLDIIANIDTQGLGLWRGGRLFLYGQSLYGKPLTRDYIGDQQVFSNLDPIISVPDRPHFTTMAEYWYEHGFYDNDLRVKIGKQDANADFAYTDYGYHFVNSSFGLVPTVPMPSFPSQSIGIAFLCHLTEYATFRYGVYDGAPLNGPQGVRWGFDTLGHHGAISLFQLDWTPRIELFRDLPHVSRFGFWHHSDKDQWREFSENGGRQFQQNYGMWYILDQRLTAESPGSEQGLGYFLQFSWSPANRNLVNQYWGMGLSYRGLWEGRDRDVLGIGIASAAYSPIARRVLGERGDIVGPSETVVELFYQYRCSEYLVLQPDLQFIANPGGRYEDASLIGLRFELLL